MILIKNATYINSETFEFTKTDIFVEDGISGKIIFVDSSFKIPENTKIINAEGKFVTKSFAVGHHHVYSALARGMGAPAKNPQNFFEILKYIWWTLDKSLDKNSIEASALVTAIAAAKAGSTFVIDHHASPNFINGSLEIIAKAFDRVGVSHLLCYEITDRDGIKKADEGIEESENYIKKNQALIGLHASFTVSDQTMKKASDLMQKYNSGFHIHVAEDKYDQEHSIINYGKRVVERLNDFGVLDSYKTILGHCLHLSENEKSILKNSNVWVVQNTESNLNNNVGYFNSRGLGKNIMLGTDGMHSDMIRSAQNAFYVGQGFDNIDFGSTYERFRNVHKYISQNNFIGDNENNLVVIDYQTPTPINSDNFLGHFIFGLNSSNIQHVISNGKLIVENRKMTTVNEDEIFAFAQEEAKKLWARMKKL